VERADTKNLSWIHPRLSSQTIKIYFLLCPPRLVGNFWHSACQLSRKSSTRTPKRHHSILVVCSSRLSDFTYYFDSNPLICHFVLFMACIQINDFLHLNLAEQSLNGVRYNIKIVFSFHLPSFFLVLLNQVDYFRKRQPLIPILPDHSILP